MAVHTRSPQTIGEACPWPGISAFQIAPAGSQADFAVATSACEGELVGTSCSMQVPSPRGPRQPGQNSALDVAADGFGKLTTRLASRMAKARIRFMTSRISFGANAPQIANTVEVRTECSICLIPYGTQIHRSRDHTISEAGAQVFGDSNFGVFLRTFWGEIRFKTHTQLMTM